MILLCHATMSRRSELEQLSYEGVVLPRGRTTHGVSMATPRHEGLGDPKNPVILDSDGIPPYLILHFKAKKGKSAKASNRCDEFLWLLGR